MVAEAGRDRATFIHLVERGDYRKFLEDKLAQAQSEIDAFNKGTGWRSIMEAFGWDSWDVSDHVPYDESYMDFVGSREELAKAYPGYPEDEE
jgi:hypothetical protein